MLLQHLKLCRAGVVGMAMRDRPRFCMNVAIPRDVPKTVRGIAIAALSARSLVLDDDVDRVLACKRPR
jgi:hypothetical protein